jgi:hypothetical protein
MKLTIFLSVTAILATITSACENGLQKTTSCDCKEFYETSRDSKHPLLEFRNAYTGSELGSFLNDIYSDTLLFEDSLPELNYTEFQNAFRVNIDANNRFQNSPNIAYALVKDTSAIMKALDLGQEKHWLEIYPIRFLWSKTTVSFIDDEHEYHTLYAVKTEVWENDELSHKDISDARVSQDPNNGEYGVTISMTEDGSHKWSAYTQKNVGNFIAIISRNNALSAPVINGPITGGQTLIAGGFSPNEAKDLSHQLSCSSYINKVGREQFEKEISNCKSN